MEGLVGIGMRMDTGAENVGSATAAVPNGAILVDESNDCFVPFSTSTAAFNRRQQSLLSRLCGESTGGQMEQTLLHLTAPYTKQSALGSKIPVPAHEH